MNEAQTFLFVSAVLLFGWIGFFARTETQKAYNMICFIIFFGGNIVMGMNALINLVFLLAKNL